MAYRISSATGSIAAIGACLVSLAGPAIASPQTSQPGAVLQPVAAPSSPTTPQAAATAEEALVSRIALYPDDLIAIILPASTQPLDIVEAERFLEKRKKDPKAEIPQNWDDAVKSLVNYPVIITSMSQDLDWTRALGAAVTADSAGMIAAVQSYRRKVNAAGNLKSDAKQTVVVEKEVIRIVQADPQVIYVPQYNPVTVMSYGYSSWGYYGAPYPVYYYPYPPGAAIGAGIIWGAAIGAAWNGGRYVSHYGGNNINIDRGDINIDRGGLGQGNLGQGNRGQAGASAGTSNLGRGQGEGGTAWSPKASQGGPQPGNRVGDAGYANRAGGGSAMGPQISNRAGGGSAMGPQISNRAGGGSAMGPQISNRAGGASAGSMGPRVGDSSFGRGGGDFGGRGAGASQYGGSRASAFSGYGNRAATSMSSNRGAMSRGGARAGGGRRR